MRRFLVLMSGLLLVSTEAVAQDTATLPVQQFLPSNGVGDYNHVMGVLEGESMRSTVGLVFHYASLPLIYRLSDGSYIPMLNRQPQAELLGELELGSRFSLGLSVPMVLGQLGGESAFLGLPEIPSSALGDIRVVPRATLLSGGALSIAMALPVSIPTGDEAGYTGEPGLTLRPTMVLEHRTDGPLRLGLNLGYLWRPEVTQNGLTVGPEVTYGLGIGYELKEDKLEAMAELFGRASFADDDGVTKSTLPEELLLSARWRPMNGHQLTVGGGPGLIKGYGTPSFRLLLSYSASFGGRASGERPAGDRDRDGVADDVDECPKIKEDFDLFQDDDGCPDPDNDKDQIPDYSDKCVDIAEDLDNFQDSDGCPDPDNDQDLILDVNDQCPGEPELVNGFEDEDGCPEKDADGDGILDAIDQCPNEPEVVNHFKDDDGCPEPDQDGDGAVDGLDKCPKMPETVNGFKDEDGCPELDSDKDGIVDALDKCPKVPEVKNNFKDDDGCPEPDTDKDGLVDGLDECPKMPETRNNYQDDDGCPDQEPKIEVTATSIKLSERVFFDTGTAQLKPKSQALLTRVAKVLEAHPEVTKLRIEGHTDNVGDPQMNLDLSQRRAESVRDFLVQQGISATRLEAVGYGETRPMVSNTSAAGREKNRRVVLWILEMNGQPVDQH